MPWEFLTSLLGFGVVVLQFMRWYLSFRRERKRDNDNRKTKPDKPAE